MNVLNCFAVLLSFFFVSMDKFRNSQHQLSLASDLILNGFTGESGIVYAVKLYPAGATTNSQDGVTDLFGKCVPVLKEMVDQNMPLLVLLYFKNFNKFYGWL